MKFTSSKCILFLRLSYCNIFERDKSPLKYLKFLKALSDDFHDRQDFGVTLVIGEVTVNR